MTGWFKDFEERRFAVNGAEIAARLGGDRDKPALMLLHGFPQTHAMWHRVAQLLRHDFFLVLPDLRGYGIRHTRRACRTTATTANAPWRRTSLR